MRAQTENRSRQRVTIAGKHVNDKRRIASAGGGSVLA